MTFDAEEVADRIRIHGRRARADRVWCGVVRGPRRHVPAPGRRHRSLPRRILLFALLVWLRAEVAWRCSRVEQRRAEQGAAGGVRWANVRLSLDRIQFIHKHLRPDGYLSSVVSTQYQCRQTDP